MTDLEQHPYYRDPHFIAKLKLYRTAYSVELESPVQLLTVNMNQERVAVTARDLQGAIRDFHPTELVNYVL